jgi:hypothetical protein
VLVSKLYNLALHDGIEYAKNNTLSTWSIFWSSNFDTETDSVRKEKKQNRKNYSLIMRNIM